MVRAGATEPRSNRYDWGIFLRWVSRRDQQSGQPAFLKVINLKKAITLYALEGVPTAEALNRVTDSHLFEVQLAEICRDRKMDRIIRVIDHGDIPAEIPLLGKVGIPYTIF